MKRYLPFVSILLFAVSGVASCSKENNVTVGGGEASDECGEAPPEKGVIDQFECGYPGSLPLWEGRSGGWYTVSDGQEGNTFLEANDPAFDGTALRCGGGYDSESAACAQGTTADCVASSECFGASIGFTFHSDNTAFDATVHAYTGVRFRIMSRSVRANALRTVRFTLGDGNTHPFGGTCTNCFDYFGADLDISNVWTEYTLRWGDLSQLGFGDPFPQIDPSRLVATEWKMAPGKDVDLLIDDVSFISD